MQMRLDVLPVGKTTATVILTQEQVDAIRGTPGKSRVPLAITFQGATYRTSVSIYRGQWMMIVNQQMRGGGMTPGTQCDVDIRVDTEERTVEVPEELRAALEDAGLTATWERFSYTARKEHARLIAEAKRPQTRQNRLEKILETVRAKA